MFQAVKCLGSDQSYSEYLRVLVSNDEALIVGRCFLCPVFSSTDPGEESMECNVLGIGSWWYIEVQTSWDSTRFLECSLQLF